MAVLVRFIVELAVAFALAAAAEAIAAVPPATVCLVALPSSTVRTLAAKLREQKVSSAEDRIGDTHTSIRVLESCDKQSYKIINNNNSK